jgi:NAD(P)-dependent dehydrogenase (short-subunit alcohol dehydrogenase family)
MKADQPVALITGAAGGIGKALVGTFARGGYRVIGVDREPMEPPDSYFVCCDIRCLGQNRSDADRFAESVDNLAEGRLDVLINNAAVQIVKPFTTLSSRDWAATLETNLLAPFWLIRLFLGQLRESRGSVVSIASIHANLTKKHFVAYATSKGALVSLTRSLAIELAPEVRINALLPAAVDTPMLREGFADNPEGFATLENHHPLGRIAAPEEIAQAALFLSSPQAGFITGAAIGVDGGIGSCLHDPAG